MSHLLDRAKVAERIKAIFAEGLEIDQATVTEHTRLSDYKIDSFGRLEIVVTIEAALPIGEIPDATAAQLDTVADFTDYALNNVDPVILEASDIYNEYKLEGADTSTDTTAEEDDANSELSTEEEDLSDSTDAEE